MEPQEVQPEVHIRPMLPSDIDAVIAACEKSQGGWTIAAFAEDKDRPKYCSVLSDDKGPIVFLRAQKSLRLSCVWSDPSDRARNAGAVKKGLQEMVDLAKNNGFTEILIESQNEGLTQFLISCGCISVAGELVLHF